MIQDIRINAKSTGMRVKGVYFKLQQRLSLLVNLSVQLLGNASVNRELPCRLDLIVLRRLGIGMKLI